MKKLIVWCLCAAVTLGSGLSAMVPKKSATPQDKFKFYRDAAVKATDKAELKVLGEQAAKAFWDMPKGQRTPIAVDRLLAVITKQPDFANAFYKATRKGALATMDGQSAYKMIKASLDSSYAAVKASKGDAKAIEAVELKLKTAKEEIDDLKKADTVSKATIASLEKRVTDLKALLKDRGVETPEEAALRAFEDKVAELYKLIDGKKLKVEENIDLLKEIAKIDSSSAFALAGAISDKDSRVKNLAGLTGPLFGVDIAASKIEFNDDDAGLFGGVWGAPASKVLKGIDDSVFKIRWDAAQNVKKLMDEVLGVGDKAEWDATLLLSEEAKKDPKAVEKAKVGKYWRILDALGVDETGKLKPAAEKPPITEPVIPVTPATATITIGPDKVQLKDVAAKIDDKVKAEAAIPEALKIPVTAENAQVLKDVWGAILGKGNAKVADKPAIIKILDAIVTADSNTKVEIDALKTVL